MVVCTNNAPRRFTQTLVDSRVRVSSVTQSKGPSVFCTSAVLLRSSRGWPRGSSRTVEVASGRPPPFLGRRHGPGRCCPRAAAARAPSSNCAPKGCRHYIAPRRMFTFWPLGVAPTTARRGRQENCRIPENGSLTRYPHGCELKRRPDILSMALVYLIIADIR